MKQNQQQSNIMVFKVAVVGGGVIGLTTALRAIEQYPDLDITIFSEKLTPDTTADGSAGVISIENQILFQMKIKFYFNSNQVLFQLKLIDFIEISVYCTIPAW